MQYTPKEVAAILANRPQQPHYVQWMIEQCMQSQLIRQVKAEAELETLRAKVKELALQALSDSGQAIENLLDAERYRFMRDNATFRDRNGPGLYWYLPRFGFAGTSAEQLDAAIDAARAADGEKT